MGLADKDPAKTERILELEQALMRTQRQLADEKRHTDRYIEAVTQAVDDLIAGGRFFNDLPQLPVPDLRDGYHEWALWHTSDWQGHKVTTSYNAAVMRQRVEEYVRKCVMLTNIKRQAHPVRDVEIVMGGDMLEGLFNFPTQVFEVDATLFEQIFNVADLIAWMVLAAAEHYERVGVTAEWGNHGRVGSKRAVVPRKDNMDRMAYEIARRAVTPVLGDRLRWNDSEEDVQRIVIGNYRAVAIHGDEFGRNGYVAPTTLVQKVSQWQAGAYLVDGEPWPFTDCYVGHYHQHQEYALPSGDGQVYYTGSTESDNRYAGISMASTARPTQRLHFIDPEKGVVTSQHRVWL